MQDESPSRGDGLGAILVAVVLIGSAVGALGWYWLTNRKGLELNTSGLDVANVTPAAVPAPTASVQARPQEGMMIKSENGMSFADGPGTSRPGASASTSAEKRDYSAEIRKYEGNVRDYAARMSRRFPSVRQYGKDWMSYPDLRKLNDDYMRNHDPMAFMAGLARSPNFGKLVAKYATDSGVRAFVIDGVKQAPPELMATAGDALRSDATVKSLVNNTAQALGLPSSVVSVMNGGQVNQSQILSDVMNAPGLKGSTQGSASH
jgi:hypothetical protein